MLIIFLLCLSALLYFAISGKMERARQAAEEIKKMEEKIAYLEKEKTKLSDMISFFATDSFKERESKEQLNLQNPGEKVIIITKEKKTAEESAELEKKEEKESNAKKWWQMIFGR